VVKEMERMSELVFGTKAGAVMRTFILRESLEELHTAWFSRIEVNGTMVFISDPNSPTGRAEFPTRYKAVKYAREFLGKKRGVSHE
jgi:histidinol-phosphate/aromatic aminotransferase/cobyric acid decarboxylase-like protein